MISARPARARTVSSLDESPRGGTRFRNKLLDHCLRVSRTVAADPASDARVRIAIVGGGATGVELAAELYNAAAALGYYGLEVFDETRLEVTLLEAGPRILPALPESSGHRGEGRTGSARRARVRWDARDAGDAGRDPDRGRESHRRGT